MLADLASGNVQTVCMEAAQHHAGLEATTRSTATELRSVDWPQPRPEADGHSLALWGSFSRLGLGRPARTVCRVPGGPMRRERPQPTGKASGPSGEKSLALLYASGAGRISQGALAPGGARIVVGASRRAARGPRGPLAKARRRGVCSSRPPARGGCLEPALDSRAETIAWAAAGSPQQVYACRLSAC